jgi:hypothetical protein
MTLESARIRWASRQSSSYELISNERGIRVLRLASPQKFDGIVCQYIKLSRDQKELEVSYYKNAADMRKDEPMMWGVYDRS